MMDTAKDLQGKVFVVTGANSGIGLVAARNFASRGATVVLLCRNETRGGQALEAIRRETDNAAIHLYLVDFSLMSSVLKVAQKVLADFPRIDVLCNNAGAANASRELTVEGFEMTFAANHLGGFLLTQLLLPAITQAAEGGSARVVFTSSRGHKLSPLDFEDLNLSNGYGTLKAYGRSKLMNLLTARELFYRYGNKGIITSSFHPGAVRTPIWSKGGVVARLLGTVMYPFMISEEKGADTMIWLASSSDPAALNADGNYYFRRERSPIAHFASDKYGRKLWEVSMELIEPYLRN